MNPLPLPIEAKLDAIAAALGHDQRLVLQASPGAGKTTRVPLALLQCDWLAGQRILMLEPRRVAARNAAQRMAQMLNEPIGKTVGYRVRQEARVSADTRIEVITEGVFNRIVLDDPGLSGIGLVIFDEFHERSLDGDLGLALTLQSRELFRDHSPALRILIMSATLDVEGVMALLEDAPFIDCPTPQFPIDIQYLDYTPDSIAVIEPCCQRIRRLLADPATQTGHMLVFLPGQREIAELGRQLSGSPDDTVLPLHGGLSLAEQQRVIGPTSAPRKVILSTNIAETSLTIDGVHTVIDCGFAREPAFHPGSGLTRLHTRRISRASAEQRAGRAGRLGPGRCYRLWTRETQTRLVNQITPEILQADLAPLALTLLAWGVDDPQDLRWIDPPPAGPWAAALTQLRLFGAVSTQSIVQSLTPIGLRMATLPTHPRIARMLLAGEALNAGDRAALLAAILDERMPTSANDIDLRTALELSAQRKSDHLSSWRDRIHRQSAHLQKRLKTARHQRPVVDDATLLAFAFPDRIARRHDHDPERYLLSNGRQGRLPKQHPLGKYPWLVVADSSAQADQSEDRIRLALPLDAQHLDQSLSDLITEHQVVAWNPDSERFTAETRRMLGELIIDQRPLKDIPVSAKRAALYALIRERGISIFEPSKQWQSWQARIQLLRARRPGPHDWPDVSDAALLSNLENWLGDALDPINRLRDFSRIDLVELTRPLLAWPLPAELDRLAPIHWTVPSGRDVRIDYATDPPVLAVKLQEMFGCEQTPTIADRAIRLQVHLLSPAGRPLQVTQDLAGFWRTGYQQVRREMRGRYPKHPWPEDPLSATATQFTKARAQRT